VCLLINAVVFTVQRVYREKSGPPAAYIIDDSRTSACDGFRKYSTGGAFHVAAAAREGCKCKRVWFENHGAALSHVCVLVFAASAYEPATLDYKVIRCPARRKTC
jgi:hypothetical protein